MNAAITVKELAALLEARIEAGLGGAEKPVSGCYICDLLSYVIGRAAPGDAWITIMTNVNVAAVALLAEVACVIVPENSEIENETLKRAQENGIPVLKTPLTAFQAAAKIARALGE